MDRLPVTRLHLAAVALCALGFSFDLMEMALGNVLSAVFSAAPYNAPRQALALLLSSVYIGAIFGAPLLGHWADRHGRRVLLIGALTWLAATSALAAASPNAGTLSVARAMSGFALGAYPPLMFAYLTDLLPPARRGLLTFLTVAAGAIGPPMGVFFVRALTPVAPLGLEAWRWAFIAGAVGAALVALLFRLLPESPRWLQVKGRYEQAASTCARFERSRTVLSSPPVPQAATEARAEGARRGALPIVSFLYFLSPWSTVAFPLMIGAVLVNKGFRIHDTLLFVGVSTFGLMIGSGLSAAFVDRMQRRGALAVCAVAMALSGLGFALSTTPAWLMATSVMFTLSAALFVPTMTMYGSEVFPTQHRARYSSIAWAFNRIGAAAAPFVLLPLLHGVGVVAMTSVIVGTLVLSLLVLCFCPRGYAGRSVN
ncbi:MFS transporter [Variovorax sp. LT1R16]|uniref:MFS transporter n=1 Tax=Variovorax sp. LT1R16 TaxID=3443728 RepID=UPI003F48D3E0